MKVYIVTSGFYSDYHIDAVFLDKAQAEYYCALHNLEDAHIEEYDTDEHVIECQKPIFKEWSVHFRNGETESVCFNGYTFDNTMLKINEHEGFDVWQKVLHGYVRFTTSKDKDYEQAEKIACGLYAQFKYNKEKGIDPYEC